MNWFRNRPTVHHHSQSASFLKVEHLTHTFENKIALENLQFEIYQGEAIGLVGPNGAGKSTLLQLLAGILPIQQGTIRYFGDDPIQHLCIGYIPQRPTLNWNFPITVSEMVMMGRIRKIGMFRKPNSSDWEKVKNALTTVQLEDMMNKPISHLSGGQQQRLFLARALAQEAELFLLDEPFNHLDVPSRNLFLSVMDQIHSLGATIVIALHDLELASKHCNRIMVLNRRIFAFGTPQEVLTSATFQAAYHSQVYTFQTPNNTFVIDDACHPNEGVE